MSNFSLKILNECAPNKLQYLPHGVTTLEMMIEGNKDEAIGFIHPQNRTMGKNNFHVGHADDDTDFLVMWGAGKEEGLYVHDKNVNERLFLQIFHRSENITQQKLSLRHTKQTSIRPISEIELVPAVKNEDAIRMDWRQEGELPPISFKGNKMPLYYSRWFPPKPSEGKEIQYFDIEAPPIRIEFEAKESEVCKNINSDIDVFLGKKKIAEVTGDWRYSWPHAELFTVFGDSDYLILRFWLYWAHENYSKNIFLGGEALLDKLGKPKDEQTRLKLWESFNIEVPDAERFDFVIDSKNEMVSWVGTDFHYQEWWYKLHDGNSAKATILNDFGTIAKVLKNLNRWLDPDVRARKNYDPIKRLKEILRGKETNKLHQESVPKIEEHLVSNLDDEGKITYLAEGFTRKHVPNVKNGKPVAELLSSVVTG